MNQLLPKNTMPLMKFKSFFPPGTACILSQHKAAVHTRLHLDAKGRLPFEPPEPVICPCGFKGRVMVTAAKFGEDGFLVMTAACGHMIRLDLNRSPGIASGCFADTRTDDGSMRHQIAAYTYSMVKQLSRVSFATPPANYLHPAHMIREGLYAILAKRTGLTQLTSRLCLLFERMACEDPICLWIDHHVAEATVLSASPVEGLSETEWYQHRCIFFLPSGTLLGPKGEDCRILGYIVIKPGFYDLLDQPRHLIIFEPQLYLWINDPMPHSSYHLNIRLSAWGPENKLPGNEQEVAFFRKALNLVLVLNALGLSPQSEVDKAQVRTRHATKKERRKGVNLIRKEFSCNFLRFAKRIQIKPIQSTGQKMRPHNKPGWFQRYHTRTGTVWHYRPPQRANAHLERNQETVN